MTSIIWNWPDFWEYYNQIEEQERQFDALREIHKDDWIKRMSAETQAKVFLCAPLEFKQQMKNFPNLYKREAILILEMDLNKRYKSLGKRR